MIAIRAGDVEGIYSAKATFRTILDIISFSGQMYDNISEFNWLVDVIAELEADDPALEKPAAARCDIVFATNKAAFKNYLMNNVIRVGGRLEPIARWSLHRPDYSMLLRKMMAGIPANPEDYSCPHYGEDFEQYACEIAAKTAKIDGAIAIVDAKRKNAEVSTLRGLDMRRGKWNKNSKGMHAESQTIKCMRALGYEIKLLTRMEAMVDDCVKVSGIPDGYIADAPVAEHRGAYLEIKAKPYKAFTRADEYQLCTYWFLGGKPVLLVNSCKNHIEYRLYSVDELRFGWEQIVGAFLVNARRLANLLTITDLNKYSRLLRTINIDGGRKLTDRIAF